MSPAALFALAANAAMPAVTAYKYAQFALAPGGYERLVTPNRKGES